MKKYLLGLLSMVFLVASILGAPSKSPKGQPSNRSDRGSGPALWV
jgi:hypothetical protein